MIQTDDTEAAARSAVKQANHYCKSKDKEAAFLTEDKKYTGDMDEKDYKKAKTVSKVAKMAGGAVWVFGGKNESAVGGVTGVGGAIADKALGNGYTVEMRFKCQ